MIRIAGAGIAGLTAGIGLAKAGEKVTIYERNKTVGKRFNGDHQGIENWTSERDALEEIRGYDIKTDFVLKSVHETEFYSPSLKRYEIRTERPTYHLVQRGNGKKCLDRSLKRQAENAGAKIRFNRTRKNCDIIATGPKKVIGMGLGITFDTKTKDMTAAILNDKIAPKAYAYLLIHEKKGTIVTILSSGTKNKKEYIKNTIEEFKKITELDIRNAKKFAGVGSFCLLDSVKKGKSLLAGEAAGFQDMLLGFGMRYAFRSGHLAAKSILEEQDYDVLCRTALLPTRKASASNRYLFEKIGNKGYEIFLKLLGMRKEPWKEMNKQYQYGLLKKALFPLANRTKDMKEKR